MSEASRPTDPVPSPLPEGGGHQGSPARGPEASPTAVTRIVKRVRQTRDFLPTPVPEDAVTDIVDVARWTGSRGNRQPWTFIVVTDPATKRLMAEAAPNSRHIGIAPVVIAVALEPESTETDHFEEGRVTERMMIAATAHGLACGIARAPTDGQPLIGSLLGLPDGRLVRSMVSIGYPTEAAKAPKSAPGTARKPLAEVVRRERFS
jgi:nitroreductase